MASDKYDDMSVQCALDALMRAEEIKQDSKMLELVMKKIGAKKKAIDSLAELREVASEKRSEEDEGDEEDGN